MKFKEGNKKGKERVCMRARKNTKKTFNISGIKIVTVIVLLVFVFVAFGEMDLERQLSSYKETLAGYEEHKAELEQEKEKVEELREYVESDAYIEDMAREKFGLVYENEVLFKAEEK